jgi:hypothetical protein
MSPLSGRAFATAALAALLVACGGPGATTGSPAGGTPAHTPSSAAPPPAGPVSAVGRSTPVRLRIPAIGVDTPVMKLGLAADGSVQVPPITSHDRAG